MSPDPEPYRDDDEDEYAPQSIFAAGWFRAVLVLTVLAIVVVVSLPYLLNWFEPTPPTVVSQQAVRPPAPVQATAPSPAPAAPARPAEPKAAEPKPAEPKAAEPKPAEPKPAAAKPAAPPPAEKAPAPRQVTAPAPKPAPERTAKAAEPGPALPKAAPDTRTAAVPTPPAPSDAKAAKAGAKGDYWVQLGLFKEEANAQALAKAARDDGFAVEVTRITRSAGGLPAGTYYAVRAGTFPDLAGANKARDALRAKGHQGFVAKGNTP